MSASALICLAPGSEETEAVTTIDLLVRGGVKVTTASVASDGSLTIVCSRGVKLLADAPLVWDPRVNLLTSQGPGTSIDFALKMIDLLVGREKAYEVASQLVMAAGIYNYYEA